MLSVDTRVKTKEGWQSVGSRVTEHHHVTFCDSAEYTFGLARGSSTKLWKVSASRPHKWPLLTGKDTFDLRIGDVVCPVDSDSGYNPVGWLHGFLKRQRFGGDWYCMADAPEMYKKFKGRFDALAIDKKKDDHGWSYRFPDIKWSELPNQWDRDYSASYVGSFIRGFLDGGKSDSQVQTNDLATAQWLQLYAPYGGYIPSGEITTQRKVNRERLAAKSTFHDEHSIQLVRGDQHGGFRVRDVRLIREPLMVCHYSIGEKLCLIGGIQTHP